ncbi:Uncharacterised protein [Klebsiella pneumoniae subsp. rhinoscleromatis]|nr:Uncharacterised protein [Klebsiella pneumoniae subsp. rhinoscleromatis]
MLEQRGQRHVLGAKGEAVYRTGGSAGAIYTFSTAASAGMAELTS